MVRKTIFDTETCTGCRTCEIACSYHHRGIFSPSISSIEIKDRWKQLGFAILFHQRDENGHLACDRCQGEEEPLGKLGIFSSPWPIVCVKQEAVRWIVMIFV